MGIAIALFVCMRENMTSRATLGLVLMLLLNLAGLVIAILGLLGVLQTNTREKRQACGIELWSTAAVYFVMIPVFSMVVLCILLICLCSACGAMKGMAANDCELQEQYQSNLGAGDRPSAPRAPSHLSK